MVWHGSASPSAPPPWRCPRSSRHRCGDHGGLTIPEPDPRYLSSGTTFTLCPGVAAPVPDAGHHPAAAADHGPGSHRSAGAADATVSSRWVHRCGDSGVGTFIPTQQARGIVLLVCTAFVLKHRTEQGGGRRRGNIFHAHVSANMPLDRFIHYPPPLIISSTTPPRTLCRPAYYRLMTLYDGSAASRESCVSSCLAAGSAVAQCNDLCTWSCLGSPINITEPTYGLCDPSAGCQRTCGVPVSWGGEEGGYYSVHTLTGWAFGGHIAGPFVLGLTRRPLSSLAPY